ncbi:TOMM precursor leader peptide-binding protein [Streptomyces sp. NPDC048507]|uniref:TOMM precursor leader peptide-binding protein n=1 Tax=Streptomyces sp. NPDC048507 TaxID=3365560 RepID=UPI003714B740
MASENSREKLGPDTRVFLRQDSVFLESEDGVFLRSGAGDFYIKGASAYAWLSRLAGDLAGGTTLRELCEGLPQERAGVLSGLVRHLADKEFVRILDDEPDHLLGADEQERFAEQLAYLAHHTRTPRTALRRVRDARVAVLGGHGPESGAWSAVRTLARNGVGHLALLGGTPPATEPGGPASVTEPGGPVPAGLPARLDLLPASWTDGWQEALTAWRPTAVIATPDGVPGALLGPLAGLARRTGAAFLSARVHGDLVVKGPLTAAARPDAPRQDATACPACLGLQLAEHADEALAARVLRDGTMTADRTRHRAGPGGGAVSPLLLAVTANDLATELFKHLCGAVEADLLGAVVLQDADTLETWREPVPRRADCPSCGGHPTPDDGPVSRLKEFREGLLDLPASPEDRLTRYRSVSGRTTTILRAFDDDDLRQTPVRSARIRTAAAVGGAAHGFGVTTSHAARARAAERALRHAAAHAPALLPVRHATAAQLDAEGARWAAPLPGAAPAAARDWTPALRLRDDALVWVPLERALTDGGVGVGATVRDVVGAALTAALLEERLRDWLDGRCTPGPVDPAALDAPHLPPALSLLRTGRLALTALAPEAEGGLEVVIGRYEPADGGLPLQLAGGAPTRGEAAATALRELAGLVAHPDAARGPGGPHHVLCPPGWPAPPGEALNLTDLTALLDLAGTGTPADPATPEPPVAPAGESGPDDFLALLGPGRDALLLELAPAGLPRTPAGGPVVLAGRVLLLGAPPRPA